MPIETFDSALAELEAHPPAFALAPARDRALRAIGRFIESTTRENGEFDLRRWPNPFWERLAARMEETFRALNETPAASDRVAVWQLYNDGIVYRSGDCTLGFDVVTLPREFSWREPEGWPAMAVASLDALFVTHRHRDHCDSAVVEACLEAGIPVFMPSSLAECWPGAGGAKAVRDGERIEIAGARIEARQGIHVWRDTIGDIDLIYYEVVLPNGFVFVFTGDLDYTKRFEVTPGVTPDLLSITWRNPNEEFEEGHPRCRSNTLEAVRIALARARPRRLLFEHGAELKHVYEGFAASLDMTSDLRPHLDTPNDLLFWGERIELPAPDGGDNA